MDGSMVVAGGEVVEVLVVGRLAPCLPVALAEAVVVSHKPSASLLSLTLLTEISTSLMV